MIVTDYFYIIILLYNNIIITIGSVFKYPIAITLKHVIFTITQCQVTNVITD